MQALIKAHAPNLILVGASGPPCRTLKDDLLAVRDHILEYDPEFLRSRMENSTFDVR